MDWKQVDLNRLEFFLAIGLVVLLSAAPAKAQSDSKALEKDYQDKLQRLNERYEDFFVQQQQTKRRRVARQQAALSHKKIRNDQSKAYEESRMQYIQKRPLRQRKLKERERLEKVWEENREKEQARLAKLRKRQIKNRKSLEKLKNQARRIPAYKELGLEESLERLEESME